MENEMVERVARTLLDDADWTGDSTGEPDEPTGWNALGADWQARYRSMARAAIKAMREPTNSMENAAMAAADRVDQIDNEGDTNAIYRAMIDAALEPAKQPA